MARPRKSTTTTITVTTKPAPGRCYVCEEKPAGTHKLILKGREHVGVCDGCWDILHPSTSTTSTSTNKKEAAAA